MPEEFRYPIRKPSDLPDPADCAELALEQTETARDLIHAAVEAEADQPEERVSPAYGLYHRAADHLREAAYRCDTAAAHQTIRWRDRMQSLGFDPAGAASGGDPPPG